MAEPIAVRSPARRGGLDRQGTGLSGRAVADSVWAQILMPVAFNDSKPPFAESLARAASAPASIADVRPYMRRGPASHFVGGAILIVLGALFLLDNLGIVHGEDLIGPGIMIVIGSAMLATPWSQRRTIAGGVLVLIGVVLGLVNLKVINPRIWDLYWPLILVGVGILLLLRGLSGGWMDPASAPVTSGDSLGGFVVYGRARRRLESQDFQGGSVFALFGGVQADLRQANIKRDQVSIDANA